MSKITLKSQIKVLSSYKGKSKFDIWDKLKVDDILEITTEINGQGGYGGDATLVRIVNLTEHASLKTTMKLLYNYMKNFTYEEL